MPGMRWADLRTRALSAGLLAPVAIGCIWFGGPAWAVLVAVAAGGLAYEWATLCDGRPWRFPGVVLPVAVSAAVLVAALDLDRWAIAVLLVGSAASWACSGRRAMGAGAIYIGLASVALIWLRNDDIAGRSNVLFLVVVVWASDVGAYVAGRLLGGPKLAPVISPGKTWSGAAGGLLAAAVVGGGVAHILSSGQLGMAAIVAALLGIAAQGGDLLESAIKRSFKVKDSGWLIPGHGGLLDRLDGLLTAVPAAAVLALVLGRGVVLWK